MSTIGKCKIANTQVLGIKRKAPAERSFVIVSDNDEDENPFIAPRKSKRQRKSNPKYVEDDIDEVAIENSPIQYNQVLEKVQSNPTTPRHRDNVAQKIAITPRHRIGLLQRPQTPQSLRTPTTPKTFFPSVYNEARKLFKISAHSSHLIGRDNEKREINGFIETRFKSKTSGCIYVSGPPGTGKSALIGEICDQLKTQYEVQSSYCNCMSFKTAAGVYAAILDDFGISDGMVGAETTHLKKLFHTRKQSYLVILDEIDHFLDLDINLLYQLFEWSLHKTSSLVLVGIANALDLTDRFLPRLKSKNMRPQLIPFMPYTMAEIINIITTKLQSLLPVDSENTAFTPLIHPTAIMFLSKKVAAETGDIRKAFAICVRALDLIEAETLTASLESSPSGTPTPTRTPLTENLFLLSPTSATRSPRKTAPYNPLGHIKAEAAPRVTIAHVARVTAAVFGNGLSQRLTLLNLQQKAALCALAAMEGFVRDSATTTTIVDTPESMQPMTPTKTPNKAIAKATAQIQSRSTVAVKAPTVRSLYEAYARLVKRESALAALTATEFSDVLAGLETQGLINSVGGSIAVTPSKRRGRPGLNSDGEWARVSSCVRAQELRDSLKGVGSGILMSVFEGDVFV